jgi:zinc transport system substrate-binding protein
VKSPSPVRRSRTLLALLPLGLGLAACGEDTGRVAGGDQPAGDGDQLTVVTSFYPVEFLASRLAGEHAGISTLTSPGVDPHSVELTPRQVAALGDADLVLYSAGMQPAVDRAVESEAGDRAIDLAAHADLLLIGETPDEHQGHSHDEQDEGDPGHDEQDAAHESGPGHDEQDHDEDDAHDGHEHGPEDPHFWLDPERYGQVAEVVAAELSTVDPDHADSYEANLELLLTDLEALDQEFTDGLAQCRSRDLVTTHEAFGYLAHRYDLHLTGITGIAPESEPSPARLAEVTAQVRELDVRTIFGEPLLRDDIARTIAHETGTQVLTLDPIEGVTDSSAGTSYPEIMGANLEALRQGLECS